MTSAGPSDDELQSTLTRLKEQGSALLVTGAVPKEVRFRATRRLFGAPDVDRKRILVVADSTAVDLDQYLPDGVRLDSTDVSLIDWGSRTRKATRTCSSSIGAAVDDLDWLRTAIMDAVMSSDADEGGLEPSELRLAVDSLDTLFEAHDDQAVRCFVRTVTTLVRGVDGLGHVHFPAQDDARITELKPLFDARIELRRHQGRNPEQRWEIPSYGRTEWMRL